MLLFAEKKLDCFVTSQLNESIEKTTSHHRANNTTSNDCDIDMSLARSAADVIEYRQLTCMLSDNVTVLSEVCSIRDVPVSSPNESQLRPGCCSQESLDADDSLSRDEIACVSPHSRCSAEIRRKLEVRRATAGRRVNTNVADCERRSNIDGNCNKLFSGDSKHDTDYSKHDTDVDDNRNVLVGSRDEVSNVQTSRTVSPDCITSNGTLRSNQLSRASESSTDRLQDTTAVRTVCRIMITN